MTPLVARSRIMRDELQALTAQLSHRPGPLIDSKSSYPHGYVGSNPTLSAIKIKGLHRRDVTPIFFVRDFMRDLDFFLCVHMICAHECPPGLA